MIILTGVAYMLLPFILVISGKKFKLKTIRWITVLDVILAKLLLSIVFKTDEVFSNAPAILWVILAYQLLKNKCLESRIPSKNYIKNSLQNNIIASGAIESVYYFDYTNNFGYYDSLSGLNTTLVKYEGMPIQTPVAKVKSAHIEYYINQFGRNIVVEYINSRISKLCSISEDEAEKSNQFIILRYDNGSIIYFEYDADFCKVFEMVEQYEV